MRHEMTVIMELYRTGKTDEAEQIYSKWQTALAEAMPVLICADPMLNAALTRYECRAKDRNIRLHVSHNIPGEIPVDTIKLSVMVANALENALAAADKAADDNERLILIIVMVMPGKCLI